MTFDAGHDRAPTRRQWQDVGQQADIWGEIERAPGRYETADGLVGPCELVIAGATR